MKRMFKSMKDNFFNRTIFTTQPTDHSYKHDQTWVGGVLPKLGQYKNTLIGKYVMTNIMRLLKVFS